MLTLAAGNTISGVGSVASKLTYTIMGDEVSGTTDTFKVLAQGQLPSSIATLYTVPASTSTLVKSIHIVNTDTVARTASLTVNGTAGANQILPPISILPGGFAVYDGAGWHIYNDQGQQLGVGATGATGAQGLYPAGTPALTLGTTNAAGVATTALASDSTIAVFDGTTPAAETFGAAGATGSAAVAARRDHVHAMPADPTGLPLGLTGATAATRYVGATTSGAPISGTFAVGDYIIDQTGKVWICTAAGTPGTWTQVSGGGGMTNPMTTTGDIIIGNPGSTPARLAVGTATQVLHGGTTPTYGAVVEGDLSLSDVTTADATTARHGLLPKLGGGTTNFLRADGTWAAPPAGGGSVPPAVSAAALMTAYNSFR